MASRQGRLEDCWLFGTNAGRPRRPISPSLSVNFFARWADSLKPVGPIGFLASTICAGCGRRAACGPKVRRLQILSLADRRAGLKRRAVYDRPRSRISTSWTVIDRPYSLEHILQSHLHLAHVRARRADFAEGRRGSGDVGFTPVRVIGEVEGFESELERLALADLELLVDREIPLNKSR